MAEHQQDEYQPLGFYKKHSKQKKSGFSKFQVDGEYYFCRYVDDEICMISQAYVAASGRDNGIESVKKNSKLAKRYKFNKRGEKHGFSLVAGNHQEIAISPDYTSKKKAEFVAGRMRGAVEAPAKKSPSNKAADKKTPAPKSSASKVSSSKTSSSKTSASKTKAAVAGAALAAGATSAAKAATRDDDYKPLAFYERQTKGRNQGIESFKGDDGEHYFAYFENGKIALISEGYPTAAARDNGAASVEKNISLEDRYQYRGPLRNGKYDFKLKAGNNKEIARSVWYSSAAAAATGAAYLMGTRKRANKAPLAGAALASGAVATTAMAANAPEAEATKTSPAAPITAAALATGAAVASTSVNAKPVEADADTPYYEENGGGIWRWLKWLLLLLLILFALFFLLKACAGGGDKNPTVKPVLEPAVTMITCWNGSEAESEDACPTKFTCWDGSFAVSEAACPVEVTTVTCWDGSTAETMEACPVQPAPEPEPMPVVEPEPVETIRNTTTALGAASIFMPGAAEAVRVSRLGTNPEFGDSHSLTPSGFYDKLANRYAANEYDRQYLDFLFKELGYAGGFKDVTAAAFTNDSVQNGVRGILGYSPAHAYQYSEFNMTDARDLEAFRVQSLNGKDIYFMKTCGNYFYITG